VRQFDPQKPNKGRALLTLRQGKKLNTAQADLEEACRFLCAAGCSYQRCRAELLAGGYTAAEADALLNSCYPTLPIVPPPP
jgi:hypothetical protein